MTQNITIHSNPPDVTVNVARVYTVTIENRTQTVTVQINRPSVSVAGVGSPYAGPAGPRGFAGENSTVPGPAGPSAYDAAVSGGFAGSEAAWLLSLKGATGPGVPTGGTVGQVLAKKSSAVNDTEWVNMVANQDLSGLVPKSTTVNGKALSGNISLTSSDVGADPAGAAAAVTKASVGLGNVDNTSDAGKPVSTAQQTALNGKEPSLGNPASDALVLSSTAAGVRSWVAQSGGSSLIVGEAANITEENALFSLGYSFIIRTDAIVSYTFTQRTNTIIQVSDGTTSNDLTTVVMQDNSTTSITCGTGSKTFTMNSSAVPWVAGMQIAAWRPASNDRMYGTVTSWNSGTKALVLSIATSTGSTTAADWYILSNRLYADWTPPAQYLGTNAVATVVGGGGGGGGPTSYGVGGSGGFSAVATQASPIALLVSAAGGAGGAVTANGVNGSVNTASIVAAPFRIYVGDGGTGGENPFWHGIEHAPGTGGSTQTGTPAHGQAGTTGTAGTAGAAGSVVLEFL